MGLETGDTLAELNASWPLGSDPKSRGDDHLRLIKAAVKNDAVAKADTGTQTMKGGLKLEGDIEIASGTPAIGFHETDQTGEDGRFRIVASAGNFRLDRATAADWSTWVSEIKLPAAGGTETGGNLTIPVDSGLRFAGPGGIDYNGIDATAAKSLRVGSANWTTQTLLGSWAVGGVLSGNGSGLTNLPGASLSGDASLTRLTLSGAPGASDPALKWAAGSNWSGLFAQATGSQIGVSISSSLVARFLSTGLTLDAGKFTGDGSGLTNLDAAQLTSGNVPLDRLPLAGEIGSTMWAQQQGGGLKGFGETVAGSQLKPSSSTGTVAGTVRSGSETWTCLGRSDPAQGVGACTMWQRTA